jgi:hypothetical protein
MTPHRGNPDPRIETMVRKALTALDLRIQSTYANASSDQTRATTTVYGIDPVQWVDEIKEIAKAEARPEELPTLGKLLNELMGVLTQEQLVEFNFFENGGKMKQYIRLTPLGHRRISAKFGIEDTMPILFDAMNLTQKSAVDLEE